MKKIITIIAIILLSITIGVISITVLPWATLFVGLQLLPAPPTPKVTHGEFPVYLIYEVDGKQCTIDDTIICDYAGIGMDEGHGKYIKWEEHFANENKITRFNFSTKDDQYGIKLFDGVVNGQGSTSIILDVGSPEYYLGYNKYTDYSPGCVSISSPLATGVISEEELLSKYKIKIIEEKFSKPMVGNGISTKAAYKDVARLSVNGVTVTPEESSYPSGTKQIVFTWKNNTDKQLTCEQSFYIQKKVDGKWQDIYREKAVGFSQEKISLNPNKQITHIYDISMYENNIPVGNYRVVSPVLVLLKEKKYEAHVLCGEFTIN